MSPRSEEFIDTARARLVGARHALAAGDLDLAVSAAKRYVEGAGDFVDAVDRMLAPAGSPSSPRGEAR